MKTKKTYECPATRVVRIKVENHLLQTSVTTNSNSKTDYIDGGEYDW